MSVTLAFHARVCPCASTDRRCEVGERCMTEGEARSDVLRQAREWADAEPRWQWAGVVSGPVRPYPDRRAWWEIDVRIEPREGAQMALGLA